MAQTLLDIRDLPALKEPPMIDIENPLTLKIYTGKADPHEIACANMTAPRPGTKSANTLLDTGHIVCYDKPIDRIVVESDVSELVKQRDALINERDALLAAAKVGLSLARAYRVLYATHVSPDHCPVGFVVSCQKIEAAIALAEPKT